MDNGTIEVINPIERRVDASGLFDGVSSLFSQYSWSDIVDIFQSIWAVYSVIAFILSAIFIIGIIYSYIRFNQLSEIENNSFLEAEKKWIELHGNSAKNTFWIKISNYIDTENPNDWKLAIMEADIMLEKVLTNAGYAGNTIGEQLKSASPQTFRSLQKAWDAHIVRNKIAHQGSDFILTKKIARETIVHYKTVFQEFGAL